MRVPLDWLAEWIDLPGSPRELADRLTLAGLEIEEIESSGPDLSALRVGRVLSREPHPDADRLSLCTVDVGEGDLVQIVCGAPNVAAGQRVAVASPGTTLPDGTRLKKAKIRGVPSDGMICSERELGLGEGHEGILVLADDAPLGAPLSEVLSVGETVLEVEITPNRGDWASLLGVAREVRANFGGALRLPESEPREEGAAAADVVSVAIDAPEDCYRYLARVVRGIRVGPSPDWLVRKLESAGLRAINVVVDVTNLVLLEFGQPLHAFDLHTLRGREVRVRRVRADEKIATLDGLMRELDPEDLVIADAERPVAVAGVMGGAETEVRDDTAEVLLECAHFHPTRVRKTARRLGLHTDASYRFERGVDPDGLVRAVDRAARLLAELAGGSVAPGIIDVSGADFPHTDEVVLDAEHPNRLLGTALSSDDVVALLARVDIEARADAAGKLRCTIPSYRNDVAAPVDLIEEVARIHGYDRLPETLPRVALASPEEPARHALEYRVRQSLRASGLLELRSFPGGPQSDPDALRLAVDDPRRVRLRLEDPHHEDVAFLHTSLVPALLRAVRQNLARRVERVRLFQVGRHFRPGPAGELPAEPPVVAGALVQSEPAALWDAQPPLLYRVRGVIERLFADLGRPVEFRAECREPFLHPGAACEVWHGGRRLGAIGELHPLVAETFEVDAPCALFELDLEPLLESSAPPVAYHEISRQPAVRRDIAVLLDGDQPAGPVLEALREKGGKHLVSVDLFDRYQGRGIPEGKVSLAFRVVFQRPDRALTDPEITKLTDRLRQLLVRRFKGELR